MTQVTDAMVEKALDAWFGCNSNWSKDWFDPQVVINKMRAALEAALAVAPKDAPPEGQQPSQIYPGGVTRHDVGGTAVYTYPNGSVVYGHAPKDAPPDEEGGMPSAMVWR